MANARWSGRIARLCVTARARLAGRNDIAGGVQGTRGREQTPLLQLSGTIRPARGYYNELRALAGQLLKLLWEANVIAGGHAHYKVIHVEGYERFAG